VIQDSRKYAKPLNWMKILKLLKGQSGVNEWWWNIRQSHDSWCWMAQNFRLTVKVMMDNMQWRHCIDPSHSGLVDLNIVSYPWISSVFEICRAMFRHFMSAIKKSRIVTNHLEAAITTWWKAKASACQRSCRYSRCFEKARSEMQNGNLNLERSHLNILQLPCQKARNRRANIGGREWKNKHSSSVPHCYGSFLANCVV
jgi:hypothetical protein